MNLQYLDCHDNELAWLDLSENENILWLDCSEQEPYLNIYKSNDIYVIDLNEYIPDFYNEDISFIEAYVTDENYNKIPVEYLSFEDGVITFETCPTLLDYKYFTGASYEIYLDVEAKLELKTAQEEDNSTNKRASMEGL